jgi:hypothetical protein
MVRKQQQLHQQPQAFKSMSTTSATSTKSTTTTSTTNHQQKNNFYNKNSLLPLHLGDRQESHVRADVERLRCDPRQQPVEEQCDQSGNKLKLKIKNKTKN